METLARGEGMPLRRRLLMALLAIGLVAPLGFAPENSTMVVIVGSENPISELSLAEVRHILRGDRKRWSDGSDIEVLLPRSESRAMHSILTNVFQMRSVAELAQYYLAAIFQQKLSEAPPTVSTDEAIRRVSGSKNALAVVPHSSAIDKVGVKIIEVKGL